MNGLEDFLDRFAEGIDGICLFSPSSSVYDSYAEETDRPLIVVSPENSVDADAFVELPLEFNDPTERVRFGIEGAVEQGLIDEEMTLLCALKSFDEDLDTMMRVRADEFSQSAVYGLFANSRAEPAVIRNVLEVAVELGKKGQKGKPVGALFVVGDA
ncbi:MAG: diadenylate cyclase domain-containing protein, partial [Halapricum sp.]